MQCLACQSERCVAHSCGMWRCADCSFFFLEPAERARQQATFLQVTEQVVAPERLAALKKKYSKENHVRKAMYEEFADAVLGWYGPNVRALDVGASGGFFLHELERRGAWPAQLRTLEVDPTYQALTTEYFGYAGDIANIEEYRPTHTFDVVTMFDVLEHVNDFWVALKNIHAMLAPGGRLILKLPNGNFSYTKYRVARALGWHAKIPYYLYLEPGGHLNYWNHRSIMHLETAGFTLERFAYVRPTSQQFKGSEYWLRTLGYQLNALTGAELFPEFTVILQKAAATPDS